MEAYLIIIKGLPSAPYASVVSMKHVWADAARAIAVTCTPSKRTCRSETKEPKRRQSFVLWNVPLMPISSLSVLASLSKTSSVDVKPRPYLLNETFLAKSVSQEILMNNTSLGEPTKAVAVRVVTDRKTHTKYHNPAAHAQRVNHVQDSKPSMLSAHALRQGAG